MSQIHDLFRELASGNETALAAINILESGHLPEKEARDLAQQTWATIVPKAPKGRTIHRHSFWGQGSERYVWKGLYGYRVAQYAEWLEYEMKKGHHLTPTFSRHVNIPQPRVGIW